MNKVEAVRKSVEMWKELAKTGSWKKTKVYSGKNEGSFCCYLCDYATLKARRSVYPTCQFCPLTNLLPKEEKKLSLEQICGSTYSPYNYWANNSDAEKRKVYAEQCIVMLKCLLRKLHAKVSDL